MGTDHGMRGSVETILSQALPFRERLNIRRTVFRGGPGPKVAVVSGIHGDELEGLYVCHRIAAWLEDLMASQPRALRGTIELYPGLNPLGLDTLERAVPVFATDLNRNFPGAPDGLLPQRMAAAAVEHLRDAALVVDIHSSNIYLREIPQVRISEDFAASLVPLAKCMNLDVIWVHGSVTVLQSTLAHSLNSLGIPCLVVEMGVGMRLTPSYTDQLTTGLIHAWKEIGVLDPEVPAAQTERSPLLADDSNVFYLNAGTSGLFVPSVEHWNTVRRDEVLGTIVSPLQGEVLSEVRAPVDGVLFTLREYPLVYEGSLMARIVATEAASP